MRQIVIPPLLRLAAVAVAAAVVAACSGNVDSTPIVQTVPSSASVTTAAGSTVALPAIASGGTSFTGSLGAASIATLITEAIAAGPPSGIPAVSRARSEGTRGTADTSTITPIAYVSFTVPVNVSIAAGSSLAFNLPQITAGVSYFLGTNSGSGWQTPAAGPASVSGTTLTFSNLPAFTLTAGTTLTIALYSTPANATASPSPSPTATATATATASATPSPAPTPVVAPNSITFDITASPTPAAVSVTETGSTGTITAAINCTANPVPSPAPTSSPFVAQITPPTASLSPGIATFTVTPGMETGSCTASFTDSHNATVSIPVLNSSTTVNLFSTSRN